MDILLFSKNPLTSNGLQDVVLTQFEGTSNAPDDHHRLLVTELLQLDGEGILLVVQLVRGWVVIYFVF